MSTDEKPVLRLHPGGRAHASEQAPRPPRRARLRRPPDSEDCFVMDPDICFRPADVSDSRTIAELFRHSSGGVADYIWQQLAEPGESLLDVGERRYAREDTPFSYQNCIMAVRQGNIVGMMHAFLMEESDDQPDAESMDPVLRPFAELEVPNSLYISSMSVFPAFRCCGVGSELLALARAEARADGINTLSLLVFVQNEGAVRLYERSGYRVAGRRDVVPHELIRYTGEVLLMVAPA